MARLHLTFLICVLFAVGSALVTGCSDQRPDKDLPALLKIGVLPDQDKDQLVERYTPLLEHISEFLGIPCKLIIPESYGELVESFGTGSLDLAHFGGLTFVQAKNTYGAVPLVMRDVDSRFSSYFVARTDSSVKSVEDCKNMAFAFGSRLSTSGHLMPRHFLALENITPETFFREVRYSAAHDTTVEWVREGAVALGAVNAQIYREMLGDGRAQEQEFRIVRQTPPYSDYVWAVQSSLGQSITTKLRNAFLVLSPGRESHAAILQSVGAGGFLPSQEGAFSELEMIVSETRLLR